MILRHVPVAASCLLAAGSLSAQTRLFQLSHPAPQAADDFGVALAGAGDIDRDGHADILVGAWGRDRGGAQNCGEAYVLSGRTGMVLREFSGDSSFDWFGSTLAGGGDADGDGVPDVLVGAVGDAVGGPGAGSAYLYSGRTGAQLRRYSGRTGDQLGVALAFLGDLDADGADDYAIGVHRADVGTLDNGEVVVYSGRTGSVLMRFAGAAAHDNYGRMVCKVGDVDGDGRSDFAVGAPYSSTYGNLAGLVHVRSGRDGRVLREWHGLPGSYFGIGLDGAGDVDADGVPDVIIGAFHDVRGGDSAGSAEVFSGRTGARLWLMLGDECNQLGRCVAGAGDVDGDGHADVIAGAPGDTDYGACSGTARLYSGANGNIIEICYGKGSSEYMGVMVAGVGDVDADGAPDWAAAASEQYLLGGEGYVNVISGKQKTLTADAYRASVGGGAQHFWISAGHQHAGKSYLLAGSFSGTSPGMRLPGGLVLPLNPDGYLSFCVSNPGSMIAGSVGTLDAYGWAEAHLRLPPGLGTELVGVMCHHAYVVFGAGMSSIDVASNAVPLTFVR